MQMPGRPEQDPSPLAFCFFSFEKKRHFVIIAFSFCRSYGKLSAIEGHNRMEFFKIVYNYTFVIQLLSLDLSLVIAFYPLEKTVKSYLFALLHLAGLFAFSTSSTGGCSN